jgi:hypothetical protein
MSDSDTPSTQPHSYDAEPPENDAGKALLVGILGGLVSAAGYLVYRRLPDDQRDRLHQQVRSVIESRVNDIRSSLNI